MEGDKMLVTCAVKGCVNSKEVKTEEEIQLEHINNITYQLFPPSDHLRNIWIRNMGLDKDTLHQLSAICSLHFTRDCFIRGEDGIIELYSNAVPTVLLPPESIIKNEIQQEINLELFEEDGVCSAYQCNNVPSENSPYTCYLFPLDNQELTLRWIEAMKWLEKNITSESFLCSKHFDESCFKVNENGEKILIPGSVPSIFVDPTT